MLQRLQCKEAGLRSLTKRYLSFSAAVENSTVKDCQLHYDVLLLEIASHEFSVSKADALIHTNVRQVADYDAMQQSVKAEMCV